MTPGSTPALTPSSTPMPTPAQTPSPGLLTTPSSVCSSTLNPKSVPFIPSSLKTNADSSKLVTGSQDSNLIGQSKDEEDAKSPISMVHESALKKNMVS